MPSRLKWSFKGSQPSLHTPNCPFWDFLLSLTILYAIYGLSIAIYAVSLDLIAWRKFVNKDDLFRECKEKPFLPRETSPEKDPKESLGHYLVVLAMNLSLPCFAEVWNPSLTLWGLARFIFSTGLIEWSLRHEYL